MPPCFTGTIYSRNFLYTSLNFSMVLTLLISTGIRFHFSVTLTAKKFPRRSNLPCFTRTLSGPDAFRVHCRPLAAISNIVFSPPSLSILYTRCMSAWCLRSSKLSKQTSFRRPSYSLDLRPCTKDTALLCTFSSSSMSPTSQGFHACTENSRWGLTYCLYSCKKHVCPCTGRYV